MRDDHIITTRAECVSVLKEGQTVLWGPRKEWSTKELVHLVWPYQPTPGLSGA